MEKIKDIKELNKMTAKEVYLYFLERRYLEDLRWIESSHFIDIGRIKLITK